MAERKYQFNNNLIGNVKQGRPNLGVDVSVELYRLMQFTLRDALEQEVGCEKTDKIFYNAGMLAGKYFYERYIQKADSLEDFIQKTQLHLKEKGVGVLRIEEINLKDRTVILTVDEDLDCSGLPEIDYETCIYDEGFIAALFQCFTGEEWTAKEIDCWCTGARTCRFEVNGK